MAAPPSKRTPTDAPMAVSQPVELKKLRKPSPESLSDSLLFDFEEDACRPSEARMGLVDSVRR